MEESPRATNQLAAFHSLENQELKSEVLQWEQVTATNPVRCQHIYQLIPPFWRLVKSLYMWYTWHQRSITSSPSMWWSPGCLVTCVSVDNLVAAQEVLRRRQTRHIKNMWCNYLTGQRWYGSHQGDKMCALKNRRISLPTISPPQNVTSLVGSIAFC